MNGYDQQIPTCQSFVGLNSYRFVESKLTFKWSGDVPRYKRQFLWRGRTFLYQHGKLSICYTTGFLCYSPKSARLSHHFNKKCVESIEKNSPASEACGCEVIVSTDCAEWGWEVIVSTDCAEWGWEVVTVKLLWALMAQSEVERLSLAHGFLKGALPASALAPLFAIIIRLTGTHLPTANRRLEPRLFPVRYRWCNKVSRNKYYSY